MTTSETEFREKIRKRAIQMQLGGFRPPDDPLASWFGKVNLCLSGESWPDVEGNPMLPLCQLNLKTLPFAPHRLDDIEFITVFINAEKLPISTKNGDGWCLRAYKHIEALVPIEAPSFESHIKPLPMRQEIIEFDFPCWEDLGNCPEEFEDNYSDLFENQSGFKLGGWPSLIQSEIYWAPWNNHPFSPEYVFQIDSTDKGNWCWGDGGVGYFGRGTTPDGKDQWTLEWQCY